MKIISTNRKASFEYFLLDKFSAGIVLVGSEVKSIRNSGVSLEDSYVVIKRGEAFIKNMYVKPYEKT